MRIILFNPPMDILLQENATIIPPLGLLYIGSVLEEAGHDVKVIDCIAHNWRNPEKSSKDGEILYKFDVNDDYLSHILSVFQPDIVGISNLFATTESSCIELINRIHAIFGNVITVVGGTNASARYDFFMKSDKVDFVVRGEGEYALRDLIFALEKGGSFTHLPGLCYRKDGRIIVNQGMNWVKDLDKLPLPGYHLLDNSVEEYFNSRFTGFFVEKRILTVATSRGCIKNCVFCSGMKYLGSWRARSPEKVVEEIFHIKEKFNVKEVAFVDANINLIKTRFENIMHLMIARKLNLRWTPFGGIYMKTFSTDLVKLMKRSGCHSINLAVEHGDPKMQQYIGKIVPVETVREIVKECKKEGIWSHGYFVVGLYGETDASLRKCLKYAKKANFDSISFFIATPLPGSRFYDEISKDTELESKNLRFITKNPVWLDMEPKHLRKMIRSFMIQFAVFKLFAELSPYSIYLRFKSFRFSDLSFYWRVLDRAYRNIFLR